MKALVSKINKLTLENKQLKHRVKTVKTSGLFQKNIEKRHLCCHEKNYYYLWKSNIALIIFIVDSRNMIKVSKITRLQKIR